MTFNVDNGVAEYNSYVTESLFLIRKVKITSKKKTLSLLIILLAGDVEINPGPTCQDNTYCDVLSEMLKSKGIHVCHQNMRGLFTNFNSIYEFITSTNRLDIITLSETHL
ncbi:hypothetical protein, partial [Acinetobacter baumannii]|uniref:hypothetical protein n=1 Tax=Acinetobacter baumannii TaxID=470 RepID=UPI001C066C7D